MSFLAIVVSMFPKTPEVGNELVIDKHHSQNPYRKFNASSPKTPSLTLESSTEKGKSFGTP